MAAVDRCFNIADLRRLAKRRAHKLAFDYIDGGADDEVTLRRNSYDFEDLSLIHRALTGAAKPDLSISLLGIDMSVPFFLGPSAGNRLFHAAGEAAVARAATAAGLACSLSTLSSVSIERFAELATGPKIFQVYVWKDKTLMRDMLARAKAAGFTAMMLTVDLPVHGNRERDVRNGFSVPPVIGLPQIIEALRSPGWTWDYLTSPRIEYANLSTHGAAQSLVDFIGAQFDPAFTWQDAEELRALWDGPALIKGIVHPDDARLAVKHGYDSVVVSNHGGRQLDGDLSPIKALPAIVDAVGGDVPVILDGGIRRGTDILKALCLGASAVSFARPYLYGLAAAGQAGVARAMDILTEELKRDMTLLGVKQIKELSHDYIQLG